MNKRGMQDDAPGWRSEGRSLVTGVNLWVLIACVAFGAWGAFDSMTDAEGDRIWGSLSVATPAVYAGWCMLEPALRPSLNIGGLLVRMSSACLVAPGFVALPVGLIQAVATIVPGTRATIATATADNGGFHYYWAEGIAAQLFLVPFMGWILGMCAALGVCLILSLPVLSFRAPAVIRDGSHLEKVNPTDRDSTTAFVFCGLGATILGIGLWLFGDGGEHP